MSIRGGVVETSAILPLMMVALLHNGVYGQVRSSSPDNTDKKRVAVGLPDSLEELPVPAGSTQPVGGVQTRPAESAQSGAGDEVRRGELIVAPIPFPVKLSAQGSRHWPRMCTNLRLDMAYSRTGGSWSMGVAELF